MNTVIYTQLWDVCVQGTYRGVRLRGEIRRKTIDDLSLDPCYLGSDIARERYVAENPDYYWSRIIESFDAGCFEMRTEIGSQVAIVRL